MLGVIVMVGIIGAVFLTSVQGKDPAKDLIFNIVCFAVTIGISMWLFWNTLQDGQKLMPVLAVVLILTSAWRIIQASLKLRALKQS
jgi:tryptophan-rich sensory protein